MSRPAPLPLLRALRQLLNEVISTYQFNTFCFDYYNEIYRNFSDGMTRDAKTTLILEKERDSVKQLLIILWTEFAPEMKKKSDLLAIIAEHDSSLNREKLDLPNQDPSMLFSINSIAALVDEPKARPKPDRPSINEPDAMKRFAMDLNRSLQWAALTQTCQDNRDTLYLLHGEKHHNLYFFVDRVKGYLQSTKGDCHHIVTVPFSVRGEKAICGDNWESHLNQELARRVESSREDTGAFISDLTAHAPLFIIIGNQPLRLNRPDQIGGLVQFLQINLVRLLLHRRNCAVRVLVTLEYDFFNEVQIRPIMDIAQQMTRIKHPNYSYQTIIRYVELEKPEVPSWKEVLQFLRAYEPLPTDDQIRECKVRYEDLMSNSSAPSFHDLVLELRNVIDP